MPPTGKRKKDMPWPVIIMAVVATLCAVLAYFHFNRGPADPLPRSPVVRPQVKPPAVKPRPPRESAGYIAVILDDWGYNRTHCKYLSSFEAPVTAAIMPNLIFSGEVLQCVRAAGQEAMLHLPIEPYVFREKYPRGYMMTTEMSQREVSKLLKKILDDLPGIVGVNNHEGSRGTEDVPLMTTLMTDLKRRGLFFVDSVTTGRSVCPKVAADIGIPFSKRDIFLDNRSDRASIERQFALAAKIASEKGSVLILGHDRALTLQILGEQIRKLKAQGFVFVTVKELIRIQKNEHPRH
jgi:polysaccharide deacetylase 2 family uncharacterized protein YibQ